MSRGPKVNRKDIYLIKLTHCLCKAATWVRPSTKQPLMFDNFQMCQFEAWAEDEMLNCGGNA